MSGFAKFTHPEEIQAVMDFHVQNPKGFLAEIHDKSKNLTYEGARPISAITSESNTPQESRTYGLSNSDSNYQRSFAVIDLKNITTVSMLPSMIPPALSRKIQGIRRLIHREKPPESKGPEME